MGNKSAQGQQAPNAALNRALFKAAEQGDTAEVERLLAQGAEPEGVVPGGLTPFYVAVRDGRIDLVRLLLVAGADPNRRFDTGTTPLIDAAAEGDTEVVRLLLDAGAELEARYPLDGSTALSMAITGCRVETVRLLLSRGADPHVRRGAAGSPCFVASIGWRDEPERLQIMDALLAHGADINAQRDQGETALYEAAAVGALTLARFLLERGADPNRCPEGGTPIDVVELVSRKPPAEKEAMVALLRQHGGKRWSELTPAERKASFPKPRRKRR